MGIKRSTEELMELSNKQAKLGSQLTESYPCDEAVPDADVKGHMGTKRSTEELMEFSNKQAKLVSPLTESYPCDEAVPDADVKGKQCCNSPIHKELEEDGKCVVSDSAGKLLYHSSNSPCKEDSGSGSGMTTCSSLFPPYFDHYYPSTGGPTAYSCDDDNLSSILDAPPRKHVPIGPDHQATLPEWNPEPLIEPLMWDIVISGSAVVDDVKVGEGRKECYCNDAGSVNCVQKHIKEASHKLREAIGSEKCEELGLYGMGEEVALKWTDEEEDIFHDIVYGNPFSCEKDFWKQLSLAFPTRVKSEIVSYYFNVFILRRRAAQNRSNNLDIDSDSDEWQGINDDEDNTAIGISINRKSESVAKDGKQQQHASFESLHDNFETWNGSEGVDGYLLDVCDGPAMVWRDGRYPAGGGGGGAAAAAAAAGVTDDDLLLPTCNMIEEIFREES